MENVLLKQSFWVIIIIINIISSLFNISLSLFFWVDQDIVVILI